MTDRPDVLRIVDVDVDQIAQLLAVYGLELECVPDGEAIEGTFWGEPEAGVVGRRVVVRLDTPVHSLLHEACHVICMHPGRRATLFADAGGDDLEETAVCYLQVVLADRLPGVGGSRLMRDMDRWGYSFRLGSTDRWFTEDAEDARSWLLGHGLIDTDDQPTYQLRQ